MNDLNFTYCLIALLFSLICSTNNAASQIPFDETYREEALGNREYISSFTDRNMYAVNERVHFSAFYRKGPDSAKGSWSRVLYVELVTPSGSPVANGKFHLDEKGSSGYLQIPSDARTGNYYLRSYTRWMQNFGPESYCYVPLVIINPYTKEVLPGNHESSDPGAVLTRMGYPGVTCRTGKNSYVPGEEVRLEFGSPASGDLLPGEFCLTVVRAGLCDTVYTQAGTGKRSGDREFRFTYLPEIRGISISGSVVNREDLAPAREARLHFSTSGKEAEYFGTLTDELGRFVLTLPERTGTQEIFVACESPGKAEMEVRIDQDFAPDPIPFRTGPFALSPSEKEIATRMVLNMQFANVYQGVQTNPSPESGKDSIVPFYGNPTTTINLDEFIELPTINEVFVNLVPDVFVFYDRGEPYLKIYSPYNTSIFPPLVLIDKIPVFDHKAIFSMDPKRLARIEVINDVYVRGGLMYGGMIFLTSRQGDMAAVDLPGGSYFFDYQAFHPGDAQVQYTPSDRIPDTRNTLLWIDKIGLDPDGMKTLQFTAPRQTGEYMVLVRGASPDGEIIYGKSTFSVGKKNSF